MGMYKTWPAKLSAVETSSGVIFHKSDRKVCDNVSIGSSCMAASEFWEFIFQGAGKTFVFKSVDQVSNLVSTTIKGRGCF